MITKRFSRGLIASLLLATSTAAFGQASTLFEKAPPEIEEALRARIMQFYQAHVDGKWRLADQVVAEESKDTFLGADKQRLKSYSIVKIKYSKDFSDAEVVASCRTEMVMHGNRMEVPLAIASHWKTIEGQWFWYAPTVTGKWMTPAGPMTAGPDNGQKPSRAMPGDPAVLAAQLLDRIKVDKTEILLSSYEPASMEVIVTNDTDGPVNVKVDVDGAFAGVTAKIDKPVLNAHDKATVVFACTPKDKAPKPTLTARISVEPFQKVFTLKMTFAIPPEIQKMIPK